MDWGRRGRDTATGNGEKEGRTFPPIIGRPDVSRHDRWSDWDYWDYWGSGGKYEGTEVIGCWVYRVGEYITHNV
jgi:hypothetical protein